MDGFKAKTKIQIRFGDTDALGHVNNAFYLSYMELARIEYFDNALKDIKIDWTQDGLILARAELDFRQMTFLNDDAWMHIRTSRIGTKSFDIEYALTAVRNGKEELLLTGKTVMVGFNFSSNTTIAILSEWRKAIEDFEDRTF